MHETFKVEKMNRDDLFLLDVRTVEEFENGHIENSINIPVDELVDNIDKVDRNKQIIAYCISGVRSEHAKRILQMHGFTNVINGGSWQDVLSQLNR